MMYTTFLIERLFSLNQLDKQLDVSKDVIYTIIHVLVCLSEELVSKAPPLIPADIFKFIHFQRGKGDVIEITIKEKDMREAVHNYCRELGLSSSTKWTESTTKLLHKCPFCGCFSDDAEYDSDDGCYTAYCHGKCDADSEGYAVQFDCFSKGSYKYRTKGVFESTGEMLIRRSSRIPYRKIDDKYVGYRRWKDKGAQSVFNK